jgi:hypothetical protein
VLLGLLLVLGLAHGAPALCVESSRGADEIAYLITTVENSACQFERNGSWHDGPEAASHLRDKYRWLVRLSAIATAEDFIDRVASVSTISGQPYAMRCAGGADMKTGPWLREALARHRAQHDSHDVARPSADGAPAS